MAGTQDPQQDGCALVTGAGRGIGAACARGLAADGWRVGVHFNRNAAGAEAVAQEIRDAGGQALAVGGDITDQDAVDRVFAALEDAFGPVLVLVNNAGAWSHRTLGGTKDEHWDPVIDVNLTAPFRAIRRAVPKMLKLRWGRIVNVSSFSADMPVAGQSSYTASKGGLEALTRAVTAEVARRGVTANTVSPGLIEADYHPKEFQALVDAAPKLIPAKRAGTAEDVAACVRFLASPGAAYVNGTVLTVDGGLSASPVPLGMLAPSQP
ncbi:3-oxoacyl-ACP reductase FabG [Svornostia abyssi]|uniref:3-oxoacyl-ACP reductase FabG n=1 Tax=Svornostia abyssi TaxID=2898438 RepID=A0ABY5PLC3_9ACTN|nr:3-oxoacyl-ACP reductase FabG [Parviterribacteraceae bacterium J379]